MSDDLRDEVSWFLTSLSLSQFYYKDRKNQFITNLLSKNICINKGVRRKLVIRIAGFPKTNFLLTVVTIFFNSDKTRN